ncbi:TonB-dependent receptor plug domain-containing protein [Pelagicoccus albus]|uniref:TonB-dependent receptor n=1 Tax=Pelagicoccus albus TaxID=415222 RepID=A0A7X1B9J5_9BACT|nr:TonB-dependent receptor plug domain-containing protein [Pelagicoccus albus]MBC2608174.1 TonB-dependent receptor [Pelagicoccus albus]
MSILDKRHNTVAFASLALLAALPSVQGNTSGEDLSELSLEELANVPVVESAKKNQKLFDTPAGAIVFNEEEIQSLPVDSLPELLRYAPGVNIVRATNGVWGLSIRGINSRFLGRAQFTVDDQNLYGNAFGGLYGAQHDLSMDDIASVEVVYGPGGGLWGANSANGQINVILKSALETEGTVLRTQVGTEQSSVSGRVGWAIGDKSAIRVSAKSMHRTASESDFVDDTWDTYRLGVQFDTRPSSADLFTISAEAYKSDLGYTRDGADPSQGTYWIDQGAEIHQGFNAQTKWLRQIDAENGFTIRSWAGYTEMRAPYGDFDFSIVGVEGKARMSINDKQRLVFRTSVAVDNIEFYESSSVQFKSDYEPHTTYASSSAEYSIDLTESLQASIGLTAQYDTYSEETELLPSLKLVKRLEKDSRLWLSISESTRSVPNGMDDLSNFVFFGAPMETITIPTPYGNVPISTQFVTAQTADDIENEHLDAYEIGYRTRISNTSDFVLNVFYYEYRNLIGSLDGGVFPVFTGAIPYLEISSTISNFAHGHSSGFEATYSTQINKKIDANISYSYLADSYTPILAPGTTLADSPLQFSDLQVLDNGVPNHIASAWIFAQLNDDWRLDLGFRASSSFTNSLYKQSSIFQSDIRLSWNPRENTRLSLVGRNLLDPKTDESMLRHNFGYGTEQARELSLELRLEF